MVKIFTKEDAVAAIGSGLTDNAESLIAVFTKGFGGAAIFGLNTGTLFTALLALWYYHSKAHGMLKPLAYGIGITAAGKLIKPFLTGFTGGLFPMGTTTPPITSTTPTI